MPSEPTPSKAGIETTESGERHIPASTRADGSKRKEIKIRPGYQPPEDVEVYKNRTAEAWKTRGTGGVPGAAAASSASEESGSKLNNKNTKRREARKKAKAAVEEDGTGGGKESAAPSTDINTSASKAPVDSVEGKEEPSEEASTAEKERQARNLRKKLRQAKELKEKKDSGESLLPEQFAKVIKITELVRQLEKLGFDVNEETKEST